MAPLARAGLPRCLPPPRSHSARLTRFLDIGNLTKILTLIEHTEP
jgi:hypothetical protein